MVNIECFIESLKLTWMNRLFKSESQTWLQIFEKTISPIAKLALYGSTWKHRKVKRGPLFSYIFVVKICLIELFNLIYT